MVQKYIEGDIVMYGNLIMIIKEPRDGNHFDLLWQKRVVYSNIDIEDIKPVPLTLEFLEKNAWNKRTRVCCDGEYLEDFRNPSLPLEHFAIAFTKEGIKVTYDCLPVREVKYISDLQHILFGLGLNSEMEV